MSNSKALARQRREHFAHEYLVDLNATKAYQRAYPTCVSATAAAANAYKLLKSPDVQAILQASHAKQLTKVDLKADRILLEGLRIALCDPRTLYDQQGKMKPVKDWSDDLAAAIASIESTTRNLTAGDGIQEHVVKVKFWDKPKALEMLFKHLGLLLERLHVTTDIGEFLDRARQIAAARNRKG